MEALFALFLLAGTPEQGSPWQSLLGRWTGQGTLMNQPVEASLHFERTLGDRFVRLTYVARTPDGQPMFSGEGLYRCCVAEAFAGRWADSAGHLYIVEGHFDGGTLETVWGNPAIENGRSTYAPTSAGALRVVDRVRRDDGWAAFAEIEYVRASDH
ncbi:MAG: hypothetical protein AAGE01_04320 [Pseudomonadota bacterium]